MLAKKLHWFLKILVLKHSFQSWFQFQFWLNYSVWSNIHYLVSKTVFIFSPINCIFNAHYYPDWDTFKTLVLPTSSTFSFLLLRTTPISFIILYKHSSLSTIRTSSSADCKLLSLYTVYHIIHLNKRLHSSCLPSTLLRPSPKKN